MSSTIEVTPEKMFGYALVIIGLVLLGYTAMQCVLLANGTFEPLTVEFPEDVSIPTSSLIPTGIFFGIILQIGMYGLLIAISYVLVRTGLSIARK